MATISSSLGYRESAIASGFYSTYNGTSTVTSSLTLDSILNRHLYEPVTQENLKQIQSSANNYFLNNTATGSTNYITDVTFNNITAGLNFVTDAGTATTLSRININGTSGEVINTSWTWRLGDQEYESFPNSAAFKKAELKRNLTIIIKSRALSIENNVPENEKIAQETLREMITEMEFRKYIKHGFISVPGAEGKTYQIFKNRHHTKVWKGGEVIEEVCVRISHNANVPPTDNVIAFMSMILASEEEFKKMGNVYRNLAA